MVRASSHTVTIIRDNNTEEVVTRQSGACASKPEEQNECESLEKRARTRETARNANHGEGFSRTPRAP